MYHPTFTKRIFIPRKPVSFLIVVFSHEYKKINRNFANKQLPQYAKTILFYVNVPFRGKVSFKFSSSTAIAHNSLLVSLSLSLPLERLATETKTAIVSFAFPQYIFYFRYFSYYDTKSLYNFVETKLFYSRCKGESYKKT